MSRYVIKLAENEYIEWSSVVDAPVSVVMDRGEAVAKHGEERIARTDKHVNSLIPEQLWAASPEEAVAGNRAGEGEIELSLEEIRREYAESEAA